MGHVMTSTPSDPEKAKKRHDRLKERDQKKERYAAAKSLMYLKQCSSESISSDASVSSISDFESEGSHLISDSDSSLDSSDDDDDTLIGDDTLTGDTNTNIISECRNETDSVTSRSSIFSNMSDSNVQTDVTHSSISAMEDDLQHLNSTLYQLREENEKLKIGTREWFEGKDEKVLFYTGLPNFQILLTLFNFLVIVIKQSVNTALTPFQEFTLTLMRLRLNLTLLDLAYRFAVSKTTVSTVFLKWLDVMFVSMSPLIRWPERDQLWETTPLSFRKHFRTKVVVIIDCFEVFICKPANLVARATTWSQYKHHNTVKFLIGISPQGVVTFISKAWGGRVSDKHLTENSELLSKLLPGDYILADRGFDIQDNVALYCAEVKLPAFTKGKKQLSAIDVENSRRIASVRIHVERVIGNLRNKYKILQSTLPLDYLIVKDNEHTTIDKIAVVCCALTNLCDSVVPFE